MVLMEKMLIYHVMTLLLKQTFPPQKARELISELPDDPEKTANMEKVLTVKVGMKYNVSVNVNVEDGLANGITGTVKFIDIKL